VSGTLAFGWFDSGLTVVIRLIRYRHRAEVTNGTSHHTMNGRPGSRQFVRIS